MSSQCFYSVEKLSSVKLRKIVVDSINELSLGKALFPTQPNVLVLEQEGVAKSQFWGVRGVKNQVEGQLV